MSVTGCAEIAEIAAEKSGGTGADADVASIPCLRASAMEKISSSIVMSKGKENQTEMTERRKRGKQTEQKKEAKDRKTNKRINESVTESTKEQRTDEKHENQTAAVPYQQETLNTKNNRIPETKLRAWKYAFLSFKKLTMFPI